MKISTEIGSAAKIVGMRKAVELCAKAGFDAWDFTMINMCRIDKATKQPLPIKNELNGDQYLKFARELKNIGLDVPPMTELAKLLREAEINVPADLITTKEMADAICQLLQKK